MSRFHALGFKNDTQKKQYSFDTKIIKISFSLSLMQVRKKAQRKILSSRQQTKLLLSKNHPEVHADSIYIYFSVIFCV